MENISIELDSTNFGEVVLQSAIPTVVWVWASWCHNCKSMEPFFDKAAEENKEKAVFHKLKADDNRELAKKYKVLGVPTLLYFNHGVLLKRKVGIKDDRAIARYLDPLLAMTKEAAEADELTGYFRWPFKRKS